MQTFFSIAIPSLAFGALFGILIAAHRSRPRDRLTRVIEPEAHGDVPYIEPGDRHFTGFRKQFHV